MKPTITGAEDARIIVEKAESIYNAQDPMTDPGCSFGGALIMACTNKTYQELRHDTPKRPDEDDEQDTTPHQDHKLNILYPSRKKLARVLFEVNDDLNRSLSLHYASEIIDKDVSFMESQMEKARSLAVKALSHPELEQEGAKCTPSR